jgi:hypothetical protein
MEAVIGFVVGYLAGSRDGRAGLERLRTSWHAIRTSPEVRKLAAEAAVIAEATVRQAAGRRGAHLARRPGARAASGGPGGGDHGPAVGAVVGSGR